ncbi:hypothetical protein NDU88_005451 [Pleurodeles waltl]|uniref:Uncharacterized protein n=1 Tax=Pleurodeles waltl TaxID=8319 RepID=A0AAV7QH82_PLEWA|nr:hypothetical protein NDU88_005451 [Pleurodeles waltl]
MVEQLLQDQEMVNGSAQKPAQINSLDKYTVKLSTQDGQSWVAESGGAGQGHQQGDEPSLLSIRTAIQDLQGSITPIEPKRDAVTMDINLIRADFSKISEKVAVEETHISGLLSTTKRLENPVQTLTKQSETMAARMEDQEGRACINNIRVVGDEAGTPQTTNTAIAETFTTYYESLYAPSTLTTAADYTDFLKDVLFWGLTKEERKALEMYLAEEELARIGKYSG